MLAREFILSPRGRRSRHWQRYRRQLVFECSGIEPQAKHSMPATDKDAFQRAILQQMVARRRRAFRGPVMLELSLKTTKNNPPLSHTLAKNFLDLLAQPRLGVSTTRRAILYYDDYQVHALSVVCEHGADVPHVSVTVTSLADFLDDLDLAIYAGENEDDLWSGERRQSDETNAIDRLSDLVRDEKWWRAFHGNAIYETELAYARGEAQQHFLGRTRVSLRQLGHLYGCTGGMFLRGDRGCGPVVATLGAMFAANPLRIVLDELPHGAGTRDEYRRVAQERMRAFTEQNRLAWILSPLSTPIALEVVVKPPPLSRQRGLHDLDNVVRDFLIPSVLDVLKPPGARAGGGPVFPPIALTRYDAWRVARSSGDDSPGFVSVAIVPDYAGTSGMLTRVYGTIARWEDSID